MYSNESPDVRAAILAGTIQQVQAEPQHRTATVRASSVRGTLAGAAGASRRR